MDLQQKNWEEILKQLNDGKQPEKAQLDGLTEEERDLILGLQQDQLLASSVSFLKNTDIDQDWKALKGEMKGIEQPLRTIGTRRNLFRYAAAIILPLILAGAGYLIYKQNSVKEDGF